MEENELETYRLPLHSHLACDACSSAVALVWYLLPTTGETLSFCGHHATVHDLTLACKGYQIIKDYREKSGEDLRRRLTEPAPTVDEILAFDGLSRSFAS